jgi:hypothetical protein
MIDQNGMKKFFAILLLITAGCTNIQDAQPENRNSFVYFYPSTLNSISVASALDQDGGVVMIGYRSNSLIDLTNPTMVVIKTDARGKTVWQKEFTDAATDSLYGKAVKPVADGYLIAADRIKVKLNPTTNVTTTEYNIHFYKMDLQGNITFTFEQNSANGNFFSNSINTDTQGNVVLLATKINGLNRSSIVTTFAPTGSGYTPTWSQEFDLQTRNYTNGRSVQLTTNNNIIWPSSITTNATARSYAAFPVVTPGSTFINNRLIGENDDTNNLLVSDLQRNNVGFVTIGTNYTIISGTNTTNNNFFFARLANDGNVIPGSIKYYDGGVEISIPPTANDTEKNSILSAAENNTIEDLGLAVAPATDGGYLLAGYLESRPASGSLAARGNGGKDVLLVKIDGFGNVQWTKTYGGSGDEVVNTAVQASDGGFIITGTNTLQGFASMFVIKTNASGDLNN